MKKKSLFIISFLVILFSLIITSIVFLGQTGVILSSDQIQVYFKNKNTSDKYLIGSENRGIYLPKKYTLADKINSALNIMQKGPVSMKYEKVWADNLDVNNIAIDNNIVTVNFNSVFNEMPLADRTVLIYSVVMTICDLDKIDYVKFLCGNKKPLSCDENVISASDAIYNIDMSNTNHSVELYFLSEDKNVLVPIKHNYIPVQNESVEKYIMKMLIKGPDKNLNVHPILPPDVIINEIKIVDKICFVSLQSNYLLKTQSTNQMEQLRIYSIVNSLCVLSGIDKVKLTINNNVRQQFGFVDINDYLEFNKDVCA